MRKALGILLLLPGLLLPASAAASPVHLSLPNGQTAGAIARQGFLVVRVRSTIAVRMRLTARARFLAPGARESALARPRTLRVRRGTRRYRIRLTRAGESAAGAACAGLRVRIQALYAPSHPSRPLFTGRAERAAAQRTYPSARSCVAPVGTASFRAGAASEPIDPSEPVYAGGFGLSPPIQQEADPLSTRALYISNGSHAVAFVVVDAQGYFGSTQVAGDNGISVIRDQVAQTLHMNPSDVIVQATHSHAAPTLEGIWGPVPAGYLQLVRDRSVHAVLEAARRALPANLQWANVDAPYLDNIATSQTDSYPGWTQDGQLSALRAVSAADGATIGTFVNVPAHGDIVCGACDKRLSADYFGAVRDALERELGGVAIVGPATLGREESPVQATTLDNMHWFAGTVAEMATRALAGARWIDDPTLSSTESMQSIPGTNAALLGLAAAWSLPDAAKQAEADQSGIYPIDRAITPPWLTGNVLGTPLTAVRIGRLAFLSMPGEPFPEIRFAIANGTQGADQIVALSKGQDDLGYFYPAFDYGFTFAYTSDHNTYNVAPQAGDQIIQGQLANLATLGFATSPTLPIPASAKYEQALQPGLQALASPERGDVGASGLFTTTFQAIYSPADLNGNPLAGKVHWDFGDGTSADTGAAQFGDKGIPPQRFQHSFKPGTYTVKLSATDTQGNPANWKIDVVAYPKLTAAAKVVARRGRTWTLAGATHGGDHHPLAFRWRFADGATAAGPTVAHTFAPGVHRAATLTVTDGTGTTASARATP